MRAPDFWQRNGLAAHALAPLGALYDLAGHWRWARTTPWRAPVPVICVGNPTVGGSGKTPVAIALIARLQAQFGVHAHSLSRGYGGRLAGPLAVDPTAHTAIDVGDEPLLLDEVAATAWIARRRAEGARAAVKAGAPLIVMDDGMQNPSVHKDLVLAVIDARAGLGNGRVVPAGPLREHKDRALRRADALLLVGDEAAPVDLPLSAGQPVLTARLEPPDSAAAFSGQALVAFAGIGRPDKFFQTLTALGADIRARHSFPDHHRYSDTELDRLRAEAKRHGARLVTTRKDFVRLSAAQRDGIDVLDVAMAFDDLAALDRLLTPLANAAASASGPGLARDEA